MKTSILVSGLCSAALAVASMASAADLSDDHLFIAGIDSDGTFTGNVNLNGTQVDLGYQEIVFGTCAAFSNGSVVTVNGSTASYTADCGVFDVAATIRLLSPLPSLPTSSGGVEREFAYTNPTGVPQSLQVILRTDPDLGVAFSDDVAARETISGAVFTLEQGENPSILAATIAATDQAGAVAGYDVGPYDTASTSFPMDNNAGPVGPGDVETSIGYQMTVPAGATATVRFRTIYAFGVFGVPTDFDFSSCYTTPPNAFCRAGTKGQFALKNNATDAKDKLLWKFAGGDETAQADFGDPTNGGDTSLCVYDGNDDQVTSLHLPASSTKWTALADKGYKFTDKSAASSGVTKGLLQGGAAGKSKLLLGGSGVNLPDPTLGTLATPITVQMHSGGNPGNCWESSLGTALKNDATQLKVKTP